MGNQLTGSSSVVAGVSDIPSYFLDLPSYVHQVILGNGKIFKSVQCFPANTQILTRTGFKWVNDPSLDGDEIASYNPVTKQIEYHTGKWIANPPAKVTLVEVYDKNYIKRWDNDADEYGCIKDDNKSNQQNK